MSIQQIALQLVIGLASGMLIYLTASGMSLIISGMGTINFGQGAFYIMGAFICYQVTKQGFSYPVALLLGILIPAVIGALLEFLLRPVFGLDMIYSLLITMGASYIICDLMVMLWGNTVRATAVPKFLLGAVKIKSIGIAFPFYYVFIIVVSIIVALGFWFMFNKTKLGIYFRAIISNRDMVEHLGINVQKLFTIMFMIGIALGGLAGVLNAPISGLTPKQGLTIFNSVFPALMVGGMENINGCLPASLFLGIASSMAALFLPTYYNLVPAVIMIIVMLFKPQGLFTRREA